MANHKKLLIYGGAAVGAFLLYRWYESRKGVTYLTNSTSPGGASTLSNPTSIPQSGTIAPTMMTLDDSRAFIAHWVAGHNDGRWVTAQQNFNDQDAVAMAYLLKTYFTPDGPGELGVAAMQDQYGNTTTDGFQWQYLTQKYGVS